MSSARWILIGAGAVVAGCWLVLVLWRRLRAATREARLARARRDFHRQRERLEMKFVQLAAAKAEANAPHWAECEFGDDVAYVRHRNTGELSAFVAVTVAVRQQHDPLQELGEIVGNLRAGTAVFRFDRDHWETDGRAILNLSPAEAIRFYRNDLEIVDQELAGQP